MITSRQQLTAQREQHEQDRQALQASQHTLTSERDTLRTELAQAQAELAQAHTDVETAQGAATRFRTKYSETMAALAQVRDELQGVQNALTAANQQLNMQQTIRSAQTDSVIKLYEQTSQKLNPLVQANVVTFRNDTNRLIIGLDRASLFTPGRIVLHDQGRQTLDRIAAILRDYPDYGVWVEGHTEHDAAGHDEAENWSAAWRLSALQAASTAFHLATQGVASERLAAIGSFYHRLQNPPDTQDESVNPGRIEIILYASDL